MLRTGKAIIRHLQKLSWPSREKLPEEDEPNDFAVLVVSWFARAQMYACDAEL